MPKKTVPRVSVVLPVYNAEKFIGEVLATILGQSFSDIEVIVIDDGSKDGSAKIVKKYAEADKRINYYYQKNRGGDKLGTTLNYGVSLAQGELIARADADDPWVLDKLKKQIAYLDKHPKCVAVGGGAELIDEGGRYLQTLISPSSDENIRRGMISYTPLNHGSVVFRKRVFVRAGKYRDVKYAEDLDLWIRMSRLGKLHNLPEVVFRYRKNLDGISLSHTTEQKKVIERLGAEYWRENRPRFLGRTTICKQLKKYNTEKNGELLAQIFLEDTLTIGMKYIKRDKNLLRGGMQIMCVALSGKLGWKLFLKKTFEKHEQKAKFVMIGTINTVIDVSLFIIFANILGVVAGIASIVSTSIAIVFSFFANYCYVWRSKKSKIKTIPQFLTVTLFTAWGVQTSVIWGIGILVGDGGWKNIFAKGCAIIIGMAVNYLMYKIIFTERKK